MPVFLKIIIPFLILLLVHFFYLNGKKLIKNQNLYRLKKVSFIGVEKSDPYEIIEYLGLEKGISLLFLNTDDLTKKIKEIPRYKEAEISIKYPDSILVKVEEKTPSYILKYNNEFFSIDKNGEITERKNEIKQFDYFFIEVNDFNSFEEILNSQKLKLFISLVKKLPNQEKDIINIFSSVSFSRLNKDWLFYGEDSRVMFNLGKELTFEKLRKSRYASIYGIQKNLPMNNVTISDDLVYYSLQH